MDQSDARDLLRRAGRNIRAERARKEWTQDALAHASGIGVAQIARMERGEMDSGLTKYIRVARALEVRLAVLLQDIE